MDKTSGPLVLREKKKKITVLYLGLLFHKFWAPSVQFNIDLIIIAFACISCKIEWDPKFVQSTPNTPTSIYVYLCTKIHLYYNNCVNLQNYYSTNVFLYMMHELMWVYFGIDWENLHNYYNYANEYFRNYLDWGQWFFVEEEMDDLR